MERPVLVSVLLGTCLLASAIAAADERILFDARINGHPVRLALDTGAEGPVLWRSTAKRLGLEVKEPSEGPPASEGKVKVALSEPCTVEIGPTSSPLSFAVLDLPGHIRPGMDGVLGWGCICHAVVEIDVSKKRVGIRDQLPRDVSQWLCWDLRADSNMLIVEMPGQPHETGAILIDSGSPTGVHLSPDRWKRWVREHPDEPSTLSAMFSPAMGIVVQQTKWAKDISLDGLTIRDVPIHDKDAVAQAILADQFQATLGLYALARLDTVIDGKHGKIYLRSHARPTPEQDYSYNRLGAVFVPRDRNSSELVAHVAPGTPADDAGIRNGDVLLGVDRLDATQWQTDPRVSPLSQFWSRPAGTKLPLVLRRGAERREMVVTLREIFAKDPAGVPEPPPPSSGGRVKS